MSAPEKFLARWSRKKLDAAEEPAPPPPAADTASAPPSTGEPADNPADLRAPATGAAPPAPPVFDPASLPSLDSIGAQTDIRDFLKAGVPPDLARAALRRAWTADPAIRDFKGLAENDWDFNDPNGMFGFGELGPDVDIKRMLASVFGETPKEASGSATTATPDEANREPAQLTSETTAAGEVAAPDRVDESPAANDDIAPVREGGDAHAHETAATDVNLVQRNNNIASQDGNSDSARESDKRLRSHGSALPR